MPSGWPIHARIRSSNPRSNSSDTRAACSGLSLTSTSTLRVIDNPLLRSLPVFAALQASACSGCEQPNLQVERNPELLTGPGLPLLSSAGYVAIVDNAQKQWQQVTRGAGGGALAWPALLRRLDHSDASYAD